MSHHIGIDVELKQITHLKRTAQKRKREQFRCGGTKLDGLKKLVLLISKY
jgi:hypothetical protein